LPGGGPVDQRRLTAETGPGGRDRHFAAVGASCLCSSASTVMVTSSPTITPPASMVRFQFSPKSLRLILVVAVRPRTVFPPATLSGVYSTFTTTGRVTPWMVRSPSALRVFPSPLVIFVDLKVMVG